MKTIFTILFLVIALNSNAQKFYRDKTSTLKAIKEEGYTYVQKSKNPDVYWYKRYDNYGQATVELKFFGSVLWFVTIVHSNPSAIDKRMRDIYYHIINTEEAGIEFNAKNREAAMFLYMIKIGSFATNTQYYSGEAHYGRSYDDGKREYSIIITLF
jgi:hypothetical protein